MKSLGFGFGLGALALSPSTVTLGPAAEYACPGKQRSPEQSQALVLPAVKFTPDHPRETRASVLALFDEYTGPPLRKSRVSY